MHCLFTKDLMSFVPIAQCTYRKCIKQNNANLVKLSNIGILQANLSLNYYDLSYKDEGNLFNLSISLLEIHTQK